MDLQGTVPSRTRKLILTTIVFSVFGALLFNLRSAEAAGRYAPTGGSLLVGTEATITSGATTGNVGSWRGTIANESSPGFNWTVNTDAVGGLDQELQIDNVSLNGANKFVVTINANAGIATLNRWYQICDWVSSTAVDNPADAQCTGGGWRTLNKTNGSIRAAIAETTQRTYTWHIYDGYWTTAVTTNTPVSTPLANFIRAANGRVLVRAYSDSAVASTHLINYLNLQAVVDPIYFPSSVTKIAGGSLGGSYVGVENPQSLGSGSAGATGDDAVYFSVSSTASGGADYYYSFSNVKTYTGANTILMAAQSSCSVTNSAITHRPKIYNFSTAGWEDLSTTSSTCSTTDATNYFAKNSVTLSNYVSGGEARIGWSSAQTSTLAIRQDFVYITVGSVNSDSSQCEIPFGSGTAADCLDTRDIDTTLAAPSTWQPASELESTSFGHTYYPYDNDGDASSTESGMAANLSVPATVPSGASVTGIGYALRFRSNSTGLTLYSNVRDVSGVVAGAGGWAGVGTTNAAATYTYTDEITSSYLLISPGDYVDTGANKVTLRLRTSASVTSTAVTSDVDFAMATIQWIESVSLDTSPPTPDPTFASMPNDNGSTNSVSMTSTVATDFQSPPVQYLFSYVSCLADNDTGGASSGWQAGTSYTNTGLQPNQCYAYTVQAKDNAGNTTAVSVSSSVYTSANVPGAPTLSGATTSTLAFTNNANGNPTSSPATNFAIFVSSTSPIDTDLQGLWITSAGVTSTSASWMNDTQADAVVVKNLATSTTYTFKVEAKNWQNEVTALGPAASGTTMSGGGGGGNPPSAPALNAPADGIQNASSSGLIFKMTATDPESDKLQYKFGIYSNSGCTTLTYGPYNQSSSQTSWSGQNTTCFSGSDCYTSVAQGTYTMQTSLPQGSTYYWQANAKDPLGSNTWGASSTCNGFTTTSGYWTTDSGNWSINSSQQLIVTPSSGSSVQIHVNGPSQTNAVVDFKMKASTVGVNTGNAGAALRADSGSNRYLIALGNVQSNLSVIGATISGKYSTITSAAFTFGSGTFYQFRGSLSGTSLNSWINGGTVLTAATSTLGSAGFAGLYASSTNGGVTFTYDNFALYNSITIRLDNLPSGGSWAVRNSAGTVITGSCQTGSIWDASTYNGQIPIDYDNGGGSVAVWTGSTSCLPAGSPTVTYPATGLANDIFGGDFYTYNAATGGGGGGGSTVASSSININAAGLITF